MRLSASDLKKILDAVYEIHSEVNIAPLLQQIPQLLLNLIPSEEALVGFISEAGMQALHHPVAPDQKLVEAFLANLDEHPRLTRIFDNLGSAVKITDFTSLDNWKKTTLYNEYYKVRGFDYQIGITYPTGNLLINFVSSRGKGDFSEDERTALNLVGPHLTLAYVNALKMDRIRKALALSHEAMDALGVGLMKVSVDGRILFATAKAGNLVRDFFEPGTHGMLPELLRWYVMMLDHSRSKLDGNVDADPEPLRRVTEGRELTISAAFGGHGVWWLSLRIWVLQPDVKKLQRLGLTEREAEVLFWIAQGKATSEISVIVGARPTTIKKHSQRIFEKLGVENRATAAARAIEVLQG